MTNIKQHGIAKTVREREREFVHQYIACSFNVAEENQWTWNFYIFFLTFSCYKMESVNTRCLGCHYAP